MSIREVMSTDVSSFVPDLLEFMRGQNIKNLTCLIDDGKLVLYGSNDCFEVQDCLIEMED